MNKKATSEDCECFRLPTRIAGCPFGSGEHFQSLADLLGGISYDREAMLVMRTAVICRETNVCRAGLAVV